MRASDVSFTSVMISFDIGARIRLITCSKITLKNKLLKDGIPKDIAESTVCEMVRLNYIDEDRALRRIIADEVNLRYTGPIKLLAKLSAKGYSREKIKRVLVRRRKERHLPPLIRFLPRNDTLRCAR